MTTCDSIQLYTVEFECNNLPEKFGSCSNASIRIHLSIAEAEKLIIFFNSHSNGIDWG